MSNFILCQVDGWVLDIYRGKLQRHGYFPHTQIVDVVIVVVVVVLVVVFAVVFVVVVKNKTQSILIYL